MPHDVEVRKTVTVIFTDVTEWTSLGEGLDPETLRHIMARYFDVMRGVIERHGGLVEKFIGDAVMAVFGIPTVREDDALRAVRAAAEMRSSLDALNVGLERDHGVTIQIRTGVNTGEVVVGLELSDVLATGEPVTVAARLEQTASPGEILIGQSTYRLVRDAVEAQNAGPVDLKGKSVPVIAWRLLRVISDLPGVARPFTSPMIGRDSELSLLHEGLAEAAEKRTCRAVTVVAEAGVGKSRLMAEFASSLDETTLMTRGRCLPYGEGITFWPVVEVVRQLAGITTDDGVDGAREKIAAVMTRDLDTASITEHIAAVMDLSEVAYPVQETFWAIRRFLEAAAGTHPLVIAFDDIHWGETTFLDLLEYLWGWSTTAPILILCSARPELLDRRGGWNGATARTVRLEPLTRDESATVIENLLAGGDLDAAVRGHIFDVSEGNPLFVEEVFRMLADEHLLNSAEARTVPVQDLRVLGIPPTINAVLDARLAALPDTELAVLQRASVMGRLFSWTAIWHDHHNAHHTLHHAA
jgi:class 3 adenylate cyclase